MKKFLFCTLLSAMLSSAYAAPAATPAAAPTAKPAAAKAPQVDKEVVGVWVSTERTPVVAPGTMTLTKDGQVTLAPEGFDALKGTFTAQGRFIDITMDRGRASLIYSVDKGKLTVQYENGSMQTFTKQASPATTKQKAKK